VNLWYEGSIIGLNNSFGDTFIPYCAKPSLTCRCEMGDNYRSGVRSLFLRPEIAI